MLLLSPPNNYHSPITQPNYARDLITHPFCVANYPRNSIPLDPRGPKQPIRFNSCNSVSTTGILICNIHVLKEIRLRKGCFNQRMIWDKGRFMVTLQGCSGFNSVSLIISYEGRDLGGGGEVCECWCKGVTGVGLGALSSHLIFSI